jgi:hypothetical protein
MVALSDLDGFAGIAALVNSLLLWPIVKALKNVTHDHGTRLAVLEKTRQPAKPKRKRKT